MWSPFQTSRVAQAAGEIAASADFSRRIRDVPPGQPGDIARSINLILEKAEARERELKLKLEELTDARDDAQTANQMLRRVKNDLKARQSERDAALRRAEAANEAKSQFLANVSHEIRTPMHGILGLADVLARTNLEARQQSLVQTLIRSSRGLLTLLNEILDFSKIESGRFELSPRPFSLSVCLEELLAPLRPRFESKGVELVVRVDEIVPDILVGDAVRIRQVLTNLLENGLKFTEQGYVILDIAGVLSGSSVDLAICVQDTGIGIPREKLDAIFEKFNQVDNSSTRRHPGTGLGLSICRMLVEMMGGTIDVTSALGRGTTFSVRMPLPVHESAKTVYSAAHAAPIAPAASCASATAGVAASPVVPAANVVTLDGGSFERPRVLLVEDNCVNQVVALDYLSSMGCAVTTAANGREAVAQFSAGAFDVVLMDCLMPEMDGFQATRAIRELEHRSGRPRTPVVALTANAYDHDRDACLAAGMDDFRAKPFSYEVLEGVVRKWLPVKDAAVAACSRR